MMKKLIECVPNFSEGNDLNIIRQITAEMESVEGVKVIDVDPGKATNRTVVTMVGSPDEVCEAAFRAVKKASELIDMSKHKGAHPRFGATDVCPLIPVSNISMDETVVYAHQLAERIGKELEIPVYCYESAAKEPKRKNLANCRSGEYEGLKEKLGNPDWKPDFGPSEFNSKVQKTGAIAVGARNFLIAYNVNLNTTSTRRANSVAFDLRERGRVKTDPATQKPLLDAKGEQVYEAGLLKSVKAIGWFIEEFGIAQISMNLTDISVTPLHVAFDKACERAQVRGLRVTGSELVGVVPLASMIEAGKYFLRKQQRSVGISDKELIKIAVKSLGLDELYPFDPDKKIIEYILAKEAQQGKKQLVDMNLVAFAEETSSESPAPGGGSIAAYMGALGASLGGMVANLSSHKKGWDGRWEEFSNWAEKAKYYQTQLLKKVDEDTQAFNRIMDAFALPKNTDAEKQLRSKTIQEVTRYATEVPLETMRLCFGSMETIKIMAQLGNPNSVTDAGVGALAARAGVHGACLNVKINAAGLQDKILSARLLEEADHLLNKAMELESEILKIVESKI
ncbi:MAG: glutamate formimidoyltransferase [Salinivirgaceae bacterium]|nr:glutamate formimidoyltransferase [Salinivirgaceae bacterium]